MGNLEKLTNKLHDLELQGDFAAVEAKLNISITDKVDNTLVGILVHSGKVTIIPGGHRSPELSVVVSEFVLGQLLDRTLNPVNAYMNGDLIVEGSMGTALKYMPIFRELF